MGERTDRHVRSSVILPTSKAFTGEKRYEDLKPITGDVLRVVKDMNLSIENPIGIYSVRIAPGKKIVAAGFSDGTVKVMKWQSEEELYCLKAPSNKTAPILNIRFHPQKYAGVLYATSPLGYIYVSKLSEKTFKAAAFEENNETAAMDINSSGDQLATAGTDLKIRMYDTKTMQIRNIYDNSAMSKDILTNPRGGGHTLRIQAVKFHPKHSDILVSGGWDKMVKVWDRRFSNGLVKTIVGPYIYGDGIDIQEKRILTASWATRGGLQIWDMHSGNLIDNITLSLPPTDPEHLFFGQYCNDSSDCPLIIAGGSGTKNVQIIHGVTKEIIGVMYFKSPVTTCHNLSSLLIAGSADGNLQVGNIVHDASIKGVTGNSVKVVTTKGSAEQNVKISNSAVPKSSDEKSMARAGTSNT